MPFDSLTAYHSALLRSVTVIEVPEAITVFEV